MSEWSGSRYEGDYKDGWYHGVGKFYFPNGVIYEGEFYKGEFHGEGTLIYPDGKGKYKAKWERGKMMAGDYYYFDDLQFEAQNWDYCKENDRRFYPEHLRRIEPQAQVTREEQGPHLIPEGTYDVGEGYYEPIMSIIYSYKGEILRTPSQAEVENIVRKCRYNPRVSLGDVSGYDDFIIKKVISDNNHERREQAKSQNKEKFVYFEDVRPPQAAIKNNNNNK